MKIEGLPPKFWVVTTPSPVSTMADICFESDFAHLAGQIRGGLHERQIEGIFAERSAAIAHAEELLGIGKDRTDGQYQYYVATISRCVLIPASNARQALEAGERHPELNGGAVLTVRIASRSEIEMHQWHEAKLAGECSPASVSEDS